MRESACELRTAGKLLGNLDTGARSIANVPEPLVELRALIGDG